MSHHEVLEQKNECICMCKKESIYGEKLYFTTNEFCTIDTRYTVLEILAREQVQTPQGLSFSW